MKNFKKIILTFAMAFAILAPSIVFAETTNVKTKEQFVEALKTSGTIVVDEDITIDSRLDIKDVDITLNLNNHTITFTNSGRLQLKKGSLDITGKGTLKESAPSTAPVVVYGSENKEDANYSVLTIGKEITLKGLYGVFISYDKHYFAYGAVLNVYGTTLGSCDGEDCGAGVYINGMIQGIEGNVPVININKGAVIADGTAGGIYAAGYGKWTLEDVEINCGDIGLGIKSGIFTFKNVTVVNSAAYKVFSENNNGINSTGAAIQIESNKGYAGGINITITGGSYTSTHGYAIQHYKATDSAANALESLTIDGAKVISSEKNQAITALDGDKITVKTGTFSSDVSSYVVEGYVQDEVDKQFVVAKKEVVIDTPTIDTTKEVKEVTIGIKEDKTISETLQKAIKADKTLAEKVADINAVVDIAINNQDEDKAPEAAVKAINKLVETKSSMKVASFFDITLNVLNGITKDNLGTLSELDKEITFNVALPEDLTKVEEGYTRTYYIVRYHGDEAEIIDTELNGNVLTFASDKFSTYAIAYTDTKTEENPKTGDSIVLYLTTGIIALAGIGYTALNIYKRKNN